ncbi:uncharacterized protein LOC133796191 [Humulus lupulus]|uniref:uncharacterized protein LOC133796191 n=1 Tax=Humulus lupulus TaxID=3486 RepID=UPI002B40D8E3|nr:uncharacterized protein LOC133796191 [Humulus lupulus]
MHRHQPIELRKVVGGIRAAITRRDGKHLKASCPKIDLLFDILYCQCLIATTIVSLTVNIITQRLNINVALASSSSAASISTNINSIPMLNGTNFKDWKRNLLIVLRCMDLDYALRDEQPASLTKESTRDEKADFARWDCSNRMSLMTMKHSIPEAFWGIESEGITKAKNLLEQIEERFATNDKVEMTTLLGSLMTLKYKGQGNIREYIIEMHHIVSRLKTLKIELSNDVLVLMVLLMLPA